MTVADAERAPHAILTGTKATVENITITTEEVLQQLNELIPRKRCGQRTSILIYQKDAPHNLLCPLLPYSKGTFQLSGKWRESTPEAVP